MSRASDREPLLPPARLGVLGGGQLGRMFIQVAQRMGYRTVVLTASAEDPAAQVAHEVVEGNETDIAALRRFARAVDAVTVEFENVSAAALRWLARHVPTRPSFRAVHTFQNRLREKAFLKSAGLPTTAWAPVRDLRELEAAGATIGAPLILKTASSGYDGKGQIRVERAEELRSAWKSLGRPACVVERVAAFEAEVSVLAVRSIAGDIATFPVALNRHERHILDTTVMPAPIASEVAAEARRMAKRVVEAMDDVGVLCVEFFLKTDGHLLVNEVAPRPHNSGHLTIEAAAASQFEQQARALAGLPLGPTELRSPAAMVNLLGDLWSGGPPDWSKALAVEPSLFLHLYGKNQALPGRKMGHGTVIDADPRRALERALAARRALGKPLIADEGASIATS